MDEPIIFWHRINSGDYATKLFDHFLHVKTGASNDPFPDTNWYVSLGEQSMTSYMTMDQAFDFAEQFWHNEMMKRTDEPCL